MATIDGATLSPATAVVVPVISTPYDRSSDGDKSQGSPDGGKSVSGEQKKKLSRADYKKQSTADLKALLGTVMTTPDNGDMTAKLAARMQRVGLTFPGIEIRFQNINAEAVLPHGSTEISTLWTTTIGIGKSIAGIFLPEHHTHKRHPMLQDVSGVLKPGRMTLLLGPPGAGKTTLLRTLAGQMSASKDVQFTGQLTYNGLVPGQDFVVERSASYVDQVDQHVAEMTVEETLAFASQMLGPGCSKGLHDVLKQREQALGVKPDAVLEHAWQASYEDKDQSILVPMFARLLGLEHVLDTVVGDQQLKGISGGQRRRVTVGEGAVGMAQCTFFDEASTGLDSATTFQIIQALKNMCVHGNSTTVISLLQPAPEVYDLFEDIIVMAGRRIVFQGSKDQVMPFFESLGFKCPPSKTVPDFLQEVVTVSDQELYWDASRGPYRYISPKQMTQAYHASASGQQMLATLDSAPYTHELQSYVLHKEEYALTNWQEFKAVFGREIKIASKKMAVLFTVFALVQAAFIAFIVATTFPQLPKDDFDYGNLFLSVAFLAVMNMWMNGFNFAPLFTKRLPVFFKQRALKFHGVWSWVISGTLIRLPELAMTAAVFSIIVYFSVGFTMNAGRFFIFYLSVFSQAWMGLAMFTAMGAITRSDVMAQGLGAVICLICVATSGFPIARQSIGPWFIWLYWMNPTSWLIRTVAINELTSPDWDRSAAPYGPADQSLGNFVLESRGFYTEWKWVWAGIGVELGYCILLTIIQGIALTYLGPRIEIIPQDTGDVQDDSVTIQIKKPAHNNTASVSLGATKITSNGSTNALPAYESATPLSGNSPAGTQGHTKSALPFEPMTLAFKDVSYFVPKPNAHGEELQLLHDAYGSFRPGVLTALMGASGAGKTTLMDVLAGRKNAGRELGIQTLNGHPKELKTFARVMGYVEQLDVHVAQATVREALEFSAHLRLDPSLDEATKMAFVKEVMELVELDDVSDRAVSSLSIEARKRLTIAVELVANPSILFADEPTSGLDSRAALVVMRALRNIVNTGRTVVCTIHQPSAEIFTSFDELLLLKPGGYVIYNGELGKDGSGIINYLSTFPEVAPPTPTVNPAVYMLEVTEPAVEKAAGIDWAQRWAESKEARPTIEQTEQLLQAKAGSTSLHFAHTHASSPYRQFKLLARRNFTTYWRMPEYNFLRFGATIGLGLFLGILYLNRGNKTDSLLGLQDILGSLYASTIFMGIVNALTVQAVVAADRPAFYRERSSGLYGTLAYTMAQGMAELPYLIVQGLLYTVITYFLIGFASDASKFWWFYLYFQLSLCCFTYVGIMMLQVSPALPIATNGLAFFITLWNLFCGFLIFKDKIYGWWIWCYYLNPATYVLYGTITTQLGDLWDEYVEVEVGKSVPVAQYVSDTYGYDYDFRGWLVLILFGFIIAFRLLSYLALAKFNFQQR